MPWPKGRPRNPQKAQLAEQAPSQEFWWVQTQQGDEQRLADMRTAASRLGYVAVRELETSKGQFESVTIHRGQPVEPLYGITHMPLNAGYRAWRTEIALSDRQDAEGHERDLSQLYATYSAVVAEREARQAQGPLPPEAPESAP